MINEIRWAWQRVTRGYDDRLYWNMDGYLNPIILAGLRYVYKEKAGIPGSMFGSLDPQTPSDAEARAKWNLIVFDMILAFELMEAEWSGDVGGYMPDSEEHRAIKRGLALFAQYYEALWT